MKTCKECGKEYNESAYSCNTKYCSVECRKIFTRGKIKVRKEDEQNRFNGDPIKYKSEIVNLIFNNYLTSALKRKHEFDLCKDDFNNFYQADCYYCGDKIKYIGIDRINNSIGYNKSNIVPCCTICNLMKREKSESDFINHCKKIAENHKNTI